MLRSHHTGRSTQAGFPQHLTRKSSLWVQRYITSVSHTRGRAPLNIHAAPEISWTSRVGVSKVSKRLKFETQPQIED